MSVERFIGLSFLIVTLSILIITFYPKSINIDKVDVLDEIVPATKQNLSEFKEFKESDFDFFVYRAHILSSEKNAIKLSKKITDGGYPSFVEPFGDDKDLFALYVGPFLSEDDIVTNMESIQLLSESENGEISRWKL
jgi:cell division septation protein DedD